MSYSRESRTSPASKVCVFSFPNYAKLHDFSKDLVSREINSPRISSRCLISVRCCVPESYDNIHSKGKERTLRLCLKAEILVKSSLIGRERDGWRQAGKKTESTMGITVKKKERNASLVFP